MVYIPIERKNRKTKKRTGKRTRRRRMRRKTLCEIAGAEYDKLMFKTVLELLITLSNNP